MVDTRDKKESFDSVGKSLISVRMQFTDASTNVLFGR